MVKKKGFTAENGENIFLRGIITAASELYKAERKALSAPNDVLLATLNKSRIQAEISEKFNTFFDNNLKAIGSAAYFDSFPNTNAFAVLPSEMVVFCDDYTFSVFRKCDNCLAALLFEAWTDSAQKRSELAKMRFLREAVSRSGR